jgi:hypothetical protein
MSRWRGAWLRFAAATSAATAIAVAPLAVSQERSSLDGAWEIGVEATASERPTRWREAKVPAPFEEALGIDFDGVAWYRCPLPLASRPPAGSRVRVEFAAAATAATVFCNGVEVGRHLGGWTPFRCDLTAALHFDGADLLEVRLDELVGHNTQGFLPIIEPHFGGIWQGVTLCVDRGPTIDRAAFFAFGRLVGGEGGAAGELTVRVPWLAAGAATPAHVVVELRDGERVVVASAADVVLPPDDRMHERGDVPLKLLAPGITPWSCDSPHLYTVSVELRAADGSRLDRLERRVGFRSLTTRGTTILWNGAPLQVRGLLHWGYSPPHLAPPSDREWWRTQLEETKARGFNTLKCCLWVPPSVVYELCDELGLLVWQEYPTWHPKMDAAHRAELRAEYDEFFAHDGGHPSVAFRSLTCETGHGAELAVIQELFDACHAAVPDTLVVDDSSWIGWQRVTDFWDEHPYGNNRWWPGRLAEFAEHQAKAGQKPLLLGECIAADTWCDRAAWEAATTTPPQAATTTPPQAATTTPLQAATTTPLQAATTTPLQAATTWWAPAQLDDQRRFEDRLAHEFGPDVVATLGPVSRDLALRTRKFQIERLRATLPDAGYVVSVARDFPKARMGLRDDFDRWKWSAADFAFQRDVALSLLTENDARAFRGKLRAPVVVADFAAAAGDPRAKLSLELRGLDGPIGALERDVTRVRGAAAPPVVYEAMLPATATAQRLVLTARLTDAAGAPLALNSWELWSLPSGTDAPPPSSVRVVDHLEPATLDFLEQGGRVLLRVAGAKHSLKSESMWWLRGAPFAPDHPFHRRVPLALLLELQQFDLDGGRVMSWSGLESEVDPILAFWESHDSDEVRGHLFVFDTRVGAGRHDDRGPLGRVRAAAPSRRGARAQARALGGDARGAARPARRAAHRARRVALPHRSEGRRARGRIREAGDRRERLADDPRRRPLGGAGRGPGDEPRALRRRRVVPRRRRRAGVVRGARRARRLRRHRRQRDRLARRRRGRALRRSRDRQDRLARAQRRRARPRRARTPCPRAARRRPRRRGRALEAGLPHDRPDRRGEHAARVTLRARRAVSSR